MMRVDRRTRILSVVALTVALAALVIAGWTMIIQRNHQREMEALGDLIRQTSTTGRPIMDMGPPGGGLPELDRGE